MYMFAAVYFGEGELTEAKSTIVLTNQGTTWGDSCSKKHGGDSLKSTSETRCLIVICIPNDKISFSKYLLDITNEEDSHRTYLGGMENVINEEKHILSLGITEMFSNSQTSQSNTSTSTRELIHLPVDKSALALTLVKYNMRNTHRTDMEPSDILSLVIYLLITKLNDATLNHFPVQVITLTGTFSNTSEDRETT
jgi:hypothetical protein